jgi:DUF4097 and DUF4098 domain-containing protein YvlB
MHTTSIHRFLSLRLLAVVPALALVLGGCTARWETDESITFDIAGPVAIDVESFNGDVNVSVEEGRTDAKVTVTRKADHGYLRQGESADSLASITYSAELVPTETGPVLRVRTSTTHPEPYHQRAHVTIRVPAVEGIRVQTANGRVYAKDIQGAVDIATTNADVRVMTNWPMRQAVSIVNDGGDIDYRVRGESSGAITAHADGGHVLQDCRHGQFIVREHGDEHMVALFNNGSNPIDLRTVKGDIRISVVHNPTEVGIWIIEP